MSTTLNDQLDMGRCPHCSIDSPTLTKKAMFSTNNYKGGNTRHWGIYVCARCGGVVTASAQGPGHEVRETFPAPMGIDMSIPSPARDYLVQAFESRHAPAGAVMLTASAVDAMLKEKGYKKGSLYDRIDKAADDHLITVGMAKWAHEVRLDANKPRHADEAEPLPDEGDAARSIEFAKALGDFLFVLPDRVEQGRTGNGEDSEDTNE